VSDHFHYDLSFIRFFTYFYSMHTQDKKIAKKDACPKCFRPLAECFCGKVPTQKTSLTVLVLQHPQERLKRLNSASLAHAMLENSILKVGLSWRKLSHALGKEADAKQWGVLYLNGRGEGGKPMEIFDAKRRPVQGAAALTGIVVIDGSWKQAKALWWRNPWLLRLNRIMLNPQVSSMRPQTKKEGLSTIEAVAFALECLGENPGISAALVKTYGDLILKKQANSTPQSSEKPGER
jgi:DTW domain-containing protein YfiP